MLKRRNIYEFNYTCSKYFVYTVTQLWLRRHWQCHVGCVRNGFCWREKAVQSRMTSRDSLRPLSSMRVHQICAKWSANLAQFAVIPDLNFHLGSKIWSPDCTPPTRQLILWHISLANSPYIRPKKDLMRHWQFLIYVYEYQALPCSPYIDVAAFHGTLLVHIIACIFSTGLCSHECLVLAEENGQKHPILNASEEVARPLAPPSKANGHKIMPVAMGVSCGTEVILAYANENH